jgi:hypothetical protein
MAVSNIPSMNDGVDVVFDVVRVNKIIILFGEIELCISKLSTIKR